MSNLNLTFVYRLLVVTFLPFLLVACQNEGLPWHITVSKGKPKEQVLVDGQEIAEVKICVDKKGGSGYPTTVVAQFDDEFYANLLVGQCMYFEGKRVAVRFGTPSTGKFARGTYEIIAASE